MRARGKQQRPDRGRESPAMAAAARAGSTPLKANLDDLAIADLLQTLVRTGKDAVVTIQHDGEVSRVFCEAGHIIDAESPPLCGVDAFGRILSIEHGYVTAEFQRANRPVAIRLPLEALILEHVRLLEERNAQPPQPSSSSIESTVNRIVGSQPWADVRVQAAADDASTRSVEGDGSKTSGFRQRSMSTREAMNTEPAPFPEEAITARHQEMNALTQRPAHHVSAHVEPKRRLGRGTHAACSRSAPRARGVGRAGVATKSRPQHDGRDHAAARDIERAERGSSKAALELDVSAEPASAEFRLDEAKIAVGHVVRRLPADGREHVLEVSADGHVAQILRFTDVAPSGRITLVPKAAWRTSAQPAPVAREPRMPANVAPPVVTSRPPSKSPRAQPPREDAKSDAAGRIEIVPTPREPRIRVIEGGDPKIKMLE